MTQPRIATMTVKDCYEIHIVQVYEWDPIFRHYKTPHVWYLLHRSLKYIVAV